jgi:hypothetical protein
MPLPEKLRRGGEAKSFSKRSTLGNVLVRALLLMLYERFPQFFTACGLE